PRVVAIQAVSPPERALLPETLELGLWMSRYYFTPLRQVLKHLLPTAIRRTASYKSQAFVRPLYSKEKLRALYLEIKESLPSQAKVLETLLIQKKGMLLSMLIEETQVSLSPIESLAKKGVVQLERIRLDRSPLANQEYFKTSPKPLNKQQQEA